MAVLLEPLERVVPFLRLFLDVVEVSFEPLIPLSESIELQWLVLGEYLFVVFGICEVIHFSLELFHSWTFDCCLRQVLLGSL